MKNCTKHFNERWAERIVGLKTEKEIKDYVAKNKDQIQEHANKTFEYASFIYKGQLHNNITRNYYIKDDIIFVTNTTDDAFITTYKVDMGFPGELNSTVRKGLIEEIERLRKEQNEVELEVLSEIESKENEIDGLEDQIKIMEEQLANLKKQKDFLRTEINLIKNKSANVGLELKKYTLMLINSKEFKEDLLSIK